MPSTASTIAASAKAETSTVLNRRGASLSDTTSVMVATCVRGSCGSIWRTVARSSSSICVPGSCDRTAI